VETGQDGIGPVWYGTGRKAGMVWLCMVIMGGGQVGSGRMRIGHVRVGYGMASYGAASQCQVLHGLAITGKPW